MVLSKKKLLHVFLILKLNFLFFVKVCIIIFSSGMNSKKAGKAHNITQTYSLKLTFVVIGNKIITIKFGENSIHILNYNFSSPTNVIN